MRLFRFWLCWLCGTVLGLPSIAHAFWGPSRAWAHYAAPLAELVVAEAGDRPRDWQAVLWTLEHRLRAFDQDPQSVLWDVRSRRRAPREAVARALPLVEAWLAGDLSDPCPSALSWDGMRGQDDTGRAVRCGATRLVFWE